MVVGDLRSLGGLEQAQFAAGQLDRVRDQLFLHSATLRRRGQPAVAGRSMYQVEAPPGMVVSPVTS